MGESKGQAETSTKRITRSTLELMLTELPIIGWLLVPVFAWLEHRRDQRERGAK